MEGRTTFIIAHRLSTVRRCDRILVLRDGTIAESGSFAELLRRGGMFAEYYRTQFAPDAKASADLPRSPDRPECIPALRICNSRCCVIAALFWLICWILSRSAAAGVAVLPVHRQYTGTVGSAAQIDPSSWQCS